MRRSLVALAVSLLALLAGHTPAYLDAGRGALLAQLADGAAWAAGWLGCHGRSAPCRQDRVQQDKDDEDAQRWAVSSTL